MPVKRGARGFACVLPTGAWLVACAVGFLALTATLAVVEARRRARDPLGALGTRGATGLTVADWATVGSATSSACLFGYVAMGGGAPVLLKGAFFASGLLAFGALDATLVPLLRDASRNALRLTRGDLLVTAGCVVAFLVAALALVADLSPRVAAGAAVPAAAVALLGVSDRGRARARDASSAP